MVCGLCIFLCGFLVSNRPLCSPPGRVLPVNKQQCWFHYLSCTKLIFVLSLIVTELNVPCEYNLLSRADKEIRTEKDKANFYLLIYF